MTLQEIDKKALLHSLRSTVCPACGGRKKTMQTLCLREYRALPHPMRNALYASIHAGYREAVIEAFGYLEVTEFQGVE